MKLPIIKDSLNGWNIFVLMNESGKILIANGKDKEYSIVVPKEDMQELLDQHPDYIKKDINKSEVAENKKTESEYKFLLKNEDWRLHIKEGEEEYYQQLYVAKDTNFWQARIRIHDGETAKFTIKGPRVGITNPEFEYDIPLEIAKEIWNTHPGESLEKIRYKIVLGEDIWEIDEFVSPSLKGLFLTELEVSNIDKEISKPDWVGIEVTKEKAFRNDSLAEYNFKMKNILSKNDELFYAINKSFLLVSNEQDSHYPHIESVKNLTDEVINSGINISDENYIELLKKYNIIQYQDKLSKNLIEEVCETLVNRNPVLQAKYLNIQFDIEKKPKPSL